MLGAIALGIAVPMFLAVLSGQRANDKDFNVLSPLLGLAGINTGERGEVTLVLAAAAALLAGFLAWLALASRDAERRT